MIKDPEKRRRYQREWVAKRRSEWLADKCCVKCGSKDQLEIDHIDRRTKVSHKIWSWSQERREAELAKCQVLCEPCHIEKTKIDLRRQKCPKGHTYDGLDRGRPRCLICHRENMKKYRAGWRSGISPAS